MGRDSISRRQSIAAPVSEFNERTQSDDTTSLPLPERKAGGHSQNIIFHHGPVFVDYDHFDFEILPTQRVPPSLGLGTVAVLTVFDSLESLSEPGLDFGPSSSSGDTDPTLKLTGPFPEISYLPPKIDFSSSYEEQSKTFPENILPHTCCSKPLPSKLQATAQETRKIASCENLATADLLKLMDPFFKPRNREEGTKPSKNEDDDFFIHVNNFKERGAENFSKHELIEERLRLKCQYDRKDSKKWNPKIQIERKIKFESILKKNSIETPLVIKTNITHTLGSCEAKSPKLDPTEIREPSISQNRKGEDQRCIATKKSKRSKERAVEVQKPTDVSTSACVSMSVMDEEKSKAQALEPFTAEFQDDKKFLYTAIIDSCTKQTQIDSFQLAVAASKQLQSSQADKVTGFDRENTLSQEEASDFSSMIASNLTSNGIELIRYRQTDSNEAVEC